MAIPHQKLNIKVLSGVQVKISEIGSHVFFTKCVFNLQRPFVQFLLKNHLMIFFCSWLQSAKTGDCDEHKPQLEAGRAPAERPTARDDGCSLRNPEPATGAHQVCRVLPIRGKWGEERHGSDQAGTGHGAAGEGGDRRTAGICWQVRRADAQEEAQAFRAGKFKTSPRST